MQSTRNALDPIIPGFHPDPSIVRDGDDFYLVTSSFEYFPGLPIFHSTDLVHWKQLGHVLTRPSQLDLRDVSASGGLFAPTIRKHQDRFYVTCTNVGGGGHFIVHATDPRGEWSDPVWVDQNGIDPDLFFEDGKCYFSSTVEPDIASDHALTPDFQRGIQQSLIDPDTGERHTEPELRWTGSGGAFPEAPHLFRRGKYYYLLLAEGGTSYGHMVTIARSTSPTGPWESCPNNPILSHRSVPSPLQATGHADLVELADGSWWAVFLGIRPVGTYHHLGRETFLAPVEWVDDWPVIGQAGQLPDAHSCPELPTSAADAEWTFDDFSDGVLAPYWNTLRRPLSDAEMSHTERPGALRLIGGPANTDDSLLVMLARRQQHHECSVRAALESVPAGDDEAGLTVRADERHHIDLAVAASPGGGRNIELRQRVGPVAAVLSRAEVGDGPLELGIDATAEEYTFFAIYNGSRIDLGSTPTRYVSSEVAHSFTGVYIGLYATGNGSPAKSPADWTSFSYQPLAN